MFTTAENRLALLQGLMDTDGTVKAASTGTSEYSTLSENLAKSVQFLCQSLGGRSSLNQRADGAYIVSVVSLPEGIVPFFCVRKKDLYNQFRSKPQSGRRSIVNIALVGKKEAKCISLDTIEGLYLTNDFIITHNCRIVTEPNPYVEMRKLFTTSDNFRMPVRTVFAMTAIQQPFLSADILQRALITELQAIGKDFSSAWDITILNKFGGRVGWLAHHLAVLHIFFKKVNNKEWNTSYKSSHRLANFEQMFRLFGSIIGLQDAALVGGALAGTAETQVSEYDWVMEGLKEFNAENLAIIQSDPKKRFTLQDVASWAMSREEYAENGIITNARRLSRYVKSHRFMVLKLAGFIEVGRTGNRDAYRLGPID
jgi:hypothetical protein